MLPIYRLFAGYNAWANRRIYAAAGALDRADYLSDQGAFFRSLSGTLNHVLVADRIWMRRFTGTGEAPDRLDAILYPEFEALEAARQAEDARIAAFVDGLDEAALSARITYVTVTNRAEMTQTLAPALSHFFNHQTHHRGQAHAILTRLGREAPPLDLLYYQRETGAGPL